MRKRLDVLIDEELFEYIKKASDNSNIPMNVIANELLQLAVSMKQGEIIEQQSLPVIRDIIQFELRKATAQLRIDVREDMSLEFTNEIKAVTRASDNRLAALLVRIGRDASIAYRLAFTILAEAKSATFAKATLEHARAQAGAELSRKGNEG